MEYAVERNRRIRYEMEGSVGKEYAKSEQEVFLFRIFFKKGPNKYSQK